ncbi:hypothetical protein R1flu_005315 [Riccia fluitans]|uniref:Uncharacterized protein n=1 Tax=Riccia fluitans TaxID=41844 RepID=A0ABD1YSU8_9MARC
MEKGNRRNYDKEEEKQMASVRRASPVEGTNACCPAYGRPTFLVTKSPTEPRCLRKAVPSNVEGGNRESVRARTELPQSNIR